MRQLEAKLPGAGTLLLRSLDEHDSEKGLRWGWADTREVGSMIGGCTAENKPSAAFANQDDGNLRFARRWFEMPAIGEKYRDPRALRDWRTLAIVHEMLVRALPGPISNCATDLEIKKLTYMIAHISQYSPQQLQAECEKVGIYRRTRAQAESMAKRLPSDCVKEARVVGGKNNLQKAFRMPSDEFDSTPSAVAYSERDFNGIQYLGAFHILGNSYDGGSNYYLVSLSPKADCQAATNQVRSTILGFGPRFQELTQARPIENGNGVGTTGGDLITKTPANPSPGPGASTLGGTSTNGVAP